MRYIEIASGVQIPVDQEEQALIDKIKVSKFLRLSDLNEREDQLAWQMGVKGILLRLKDEEGYYMVVNDDAHIWRF
jgi:hypothetical protein